MPESLHSFHADDTEIYASAKDCDELVNIMNCDLENVRKWMLLNKLLIHPKKTKYMYIGSSFSFKNRIAQSPILINNVRVPSTENYTCLGVYLYERLT